MIVGLTGQSGAGKSTVAALFENAGFRIIECEVLVHRLYSEPHYARKIAEVCGEDYVKNGAVDRKKLGALVFSDKNEVARLNETVHPLILDANLGEMNRARLDGVDAILDAPLLFEYALETMCDTTLGVVCDRDVAEKRLLARDGKTPAEIRGRLSAQHDASYFRTHCEYILENNGDSDTLRAHFDALLESLAVYL